MNALSGTVLVLLLVTGVFVGSQYLLEVEVNFSRTVTNQVSPVARIALLESMNVSQRIIGIALPDTVSWLPGETGEFVLGVKNTGSDPVTYYFHVSLEQSTIEREVDWILFPRKRTLPPGVSLVDFSVLPLQAEEGTYLFRVVVCTAPNCSLESIALYGTTTFLMRTLK